MTAPSPRAILAPLALLLALLAACGPDAPEEAPAAEAAGEHPALAVEVVTVEPSTFEDVIEMTGTIEAPNDVTLTPEVGGTLTYLAPLGAAVGRGQVVAQVNPTQAQASLAQAEAGLAAAQAQAELAEDQFRRQEPLFRDSIVSAAEFEAVRTQQAAARADVARAEAAVAAARQSLSSTRVVAPFGGIVEERLAEVGEQVTPGAPVARLVSTGVVKVRAGVPERYAASVVPGASVLVSPEAYGVAPRRASVSFVGRTIDPATRTFPVEVALENPGGALKPEMVVRVVLTRAVLEGVLAVPLAAVIRDERGAHLFVAEGSGERRAARLRPVVLGANAHGFVVVEEGLAAGEEVIVQGQTNLSDGDPVRIAGRRGLST